MFVDDLYSGECSDTPDVMIRSVEYLRIKMILILIGNKRGKGNGKRAVLEFPSDLIPSESTDAIFFSHFNKLAVENIKIRIQIGQEWACSNCKVVSITSINAKQCPACKKNKPVVNGEIVYDSKGKIDFNKTLGTDFDAHRKADMNAAGYCEKCWRKYIQCACEKEKR